MQLTQPLSSTPRFPHLPYEFNFDRTSQLRIWNTNTATPSHHQHVFRPGSPAIRQVRPLRKIRITRTCRQTETHLRVPETNKSSLVGASTCRTSAASATPTQTPPSSRSKALRTQRPLPSTLESASHTSTGARRRLEEARSA